VLKVDFKVREIGIVVSKKISKKAVERNKIKRLLSEAIRRNLGEVKEGYRMVFLSKKEILGKSLGEIEEEVRRVIGKNEKNNFKMVSFL